MKKHYHLLFFGIQIPITCFIFYRLFKSLDLTVMAQAVVKSHPEFLLLYFVSTIFLVFLYVYRWSLANQVFKIDIAYRDLLSVYCISQFYNQLFPGGMGGDAYRGVVLAVKTKQKTNSALNILFERGCGLYAMLFTALIFIKLFQIPLPEMTVFILELGVLLPPIGLILFHYSIRKNLSIFSYRRLAPLAELYRQILASFAENRASVIKFFLITFLYQFLTNISVTLLFEAFNVHASPWIVYGVVSVIFPVLLIPISINGFGLREGLFAMYASLFNATPEAAISVSLMLGVSNLIMAAIGGIAFLNEKVGRLSDSR